MDRWDIERADEWRKWTKEIPFIAFKGGWEVKVIPPFAGAIARFLVRSGDASVSVYLDCYAKLGAWDEPYWEIYPYDDDTYRCLMADVDDLVLRIEESLLQQREEATNED